MYVQTYNNKDNNTKVKGLNSFKKTSHANEYNQSRLFVCQLRYDQLSDWLIFLTQHDPKHVIVYEKMAAENENIKIVGEVRGNQPT